MQTSREHICIAAAAVVTAASCLLIGLRLGRGSMTSVDAATRHGEEAGCVDFRKSARPRIKNKAYRIHQNWLTCEIVVAGNEKEYHRCVRLVSRGDNVLEIGSHQGVTTRKIATRAGSGATCIGIDMSEFVTRKANERAVLENSSAVFYHGDARDMRVVRKLVTCDLDVIFIDVSGNRGPSLLMQLVEQYVRCFNPRLIVIKSYKLENFHRVTRLSTEI